MPKLGRALFKGVRHLRDRRKPLQSVDAGLRRRAAPKVNCDGDEEAPPLGPKRFHGEAKHFAVGDVETSTYHAAMDEPLDGDDDIQYARLMESSTQENKQDIIREAKDTYWEVQKKKHGAEFDEEECGKKFARKQLLQTNSNADLMLTAEVVIEEDWLGDVDAMPGNIYRLAIMGEFMLKFEGSIRDVGNVARLFGMLFIVLIQMFGPPAIFFSRLWGIGVLNSEGYNWFCCPWHPAYDPAYSGGCNYKNTPTKDVTYFDDWHHMATTKALGLMMMAAFILNGLYVLLDEKESWKQIYNTFRYLDIMNPKFHIHGIALLYVDALANTWVITWCCLDVFFVIGDSTTPADVLSNGLTLIFLYNLDDVGGDLGFVSEDDWPGSRLAWIYKNLVHPCPDEYFDEDKLDPPGFAVITMYNVMIVFVTVLSVAVPLLAACTPFIQIDPAR